MNCNQCEYLFINGIGCHETGCPNSWKHNSECKWCGQSFMPESRFQEACSHSCAVAYSGASCNCEECFVPIEEEVTL